LSAPRKSICAHLKHFDPDLEEADKVVLASSSAVWKAPIGSRIIFSRERRGDGLNLNAAFSARDDQRRSTCPIEQDRKINFARDLSRFPNEHFVYNATGRTGSMCDESLSEHLARDFARFLRRLNNVDASLESVLRISIGRRRSHSYSRRVTGE
jgi:hypothetical protein